MRTIKIDNLKINAYGNISDKQIDFKDGINIIKGENESGKSTLLSFIVNSLFGISKTKDGKELSDFDRFKPWNKDDFSGKIKYELDNKEVYEVYRDFKKKSPTIYNGLMEDITSEFDLSKKDGSSFFSDQIGIDKQTYLSTIVTMQQEVRLAKNEQNVLVQKIANLVGTGEDSVSFKKACDKLDSKKRDEIGNSRTTQKPINLLNSELEKIQNELNELEQYKDKKYSINDEKEELNIEIKKLEEKVSIIKELINSVNNESINNQKYEINKENYNKNELKINELNITKNTKEASKNEIENELKDIKEKKEEYIRKIEELKDNKNSKDSTKKKNNSLIYVLIFLFSILLISFGIVSWFIFKNSIITSIIDTLGVILLIIGVVITTNNNKKNKNDLINYENIEKSINELQEELSIINNNVEEKEIKINEFNSEISATIGQLSLLKNENDSILLENNRIKEELNSLKQEEKSKLKEKYQENTDIDSLINSSNIKEDLSKYEAILNDEKIKLKGLEIEEKTIIPQLDNMVSLEERKLFIKEEIKNLNEKEEIIDIALDNLRNAYEEMKNIVTPKFTQNLSNNISKLTDNKYDKVTINDEKGLIVENKNGEYIDANKLSVGTIDQLYLSLRLSMIEELSSENLPILIDEVFAYFDNSRLENALAYLAKQLQKHQTLIFTCTNREIEVLNKLDIKYNLIEL